MELNTGLMQAAENGDVAGVREHLAQAGQANEYGRTALMAAAQGNHVECVRLLLDKEARMQNRWGQTALVHALSFGSAEAALLLAPLEAEINDRANVTPLMWAAHGGLSECAELLLAGAGTQTLRPFSYTDFSAYASGVTALMVAASRNCLPIIKLLREREGELQDSDGHDALWYARNNALVFSNYALVRQEEEHTEAVALLTNKDQ
ncbi:Ankyrin repeat protein 1 [Giardia muris]|uniref:Ankyrin repeat protein 1 n=1 Tax=Giardia muris TaxID=5742 RepID=A0A4Z1SUD8_GIAMU|nr:Ankyrin repeat protein 1 [Giardia muris]|eukprot:TNJ28585.1 Ankyrin repeat protein 1 [Giardia muris]